MSGWGSGRVVEGRSRLLLLLLLIQRPGCQEERGHRDEARGRRGLRGRERVRQDEAGGKCVTQGSGSDGPSLVSGTGRRLQIFASLCFAAAAAVSSRRRQEAGSREARRQEREGGTQ